MRCAAHWQALSGAVEGRCKGSLLGREGLDPRCSRPVPAPWQLEPHPRLWLAAVAAGAGTELVLALALGGYMGYIWYMASQSWAWATGDA